MNNDTPARKPIYIEVTEQLRGYIRNKNLSPGSKLPGGRKLAKMFNTSKNTVFEALQVLQNEYIVDISGPSGTFIAKDAWYHLMTESPSWEKYISNSWQLSVGETFINLCRNIGKDGYSYLSAGTVSNIYGWNEIVSQALDNVSKSIKHNNILQKYDYKGPKHLREQVAAHLQKKQINVGHEDVIIIPSLYVGLDIICRGLLNSSINAYVSENLYAPNLKILNSIGMNITPIPLDEDGIMVSQLKSDTKSQKRAVIICAPTSQNIIGETTTIERRKQLLDYCSDKRYPIIELDAVSDLNPNAPPPLKAFDKDNKAVIYIGTIPIYFSLGVNVGWIVAPKRLNDRITDVLIQGYHYPYNLNYQLIYELFASGAYYKFLDGFIPKLMTAMNEAEKAIREELSDYVVWNKNARYGLFEIALKDSNIMKRINAQYEKLLFVSDIKLNNIDKSHIYLYISGLPIADIVRNIRQLADIIKECSICSIK